MVLDPGRRIGAYEIVGPLGAGGMGEVYRARDTRLGRPVAIKLVSAEIASDAAAHERLEREARLTSSLNHPNIVTVHDVGDVDGQPFIVMELVTGDTLHARMAAGRLKPKEVVGIAAQVAEGLAAAHGAGVVHRDLKPRNVMLTADGRAKIVDFGLGKLSPVEVDPDEPTAEARGLTGEHAIVGTAGYMSPEQVTGRPVDFRSDQFALGAMVYEMLTGHRAFRRETPVQTMAAVADAEPDPLADRCPDAPHELITVVTRCLAKDPAGRYASTEDLARDLRDVRASMSTGQSSASLRRPAPRTGIRRWIAAAVAAAVGIGAWAVLQTPPSAVAEARGLLVRYDKAANVSRAVELLEPAAAARPDDPAIRTNLAEAYWRLYEHTQDKSLIERASVEAAAALASSADYAPAHVVLAMINLGQGRYNGALGEAQEALRVDPLSGRAHREVGRANLALGQLDEAGAAFASAARLAPEDWTVHNHLGGYYFRTNRMEEAAASFRRALDLAPDNVRTYNNLGGAYLRLERLDEAAAMFERSATLDPNAGAFSNLGTAHFEQGHYAEAARAFERAVTLPGATFRHWRNFGSAAYWAPGLRARALEAYEKAAELGEKDYAVDPRNQNMLAELADTYAVLGRPERARALIDLLERQNPQDAQVLATLAGTYDQLGERARALDLLAAAIAAGYPPDNVSRSPWFTDLRQDPEYQSRFGGER